MSRFWAIVCTAFVLAASGGIHAQFQLQAGAVPGPVVWSEACEAFDADGDGRVDVIVTNGNGFSSAGGALAPTLLMNQAVSGLAVFADETAARLPAGFIQQGKGLTVADVDDNGFEDIIFANAFNTQPRLLINDGTGQFTDQTVARFPALLLNSFGVAAGDVDGDGDLDLVFSDAGPSFPGGPGGLARLFINDGTGHFANAPAQINAVNKVGAQQVNMVDIDNDLDLDVVVDGRSTPQQLYVNDGTGNFTLTPNVVPAGSGSTYETDFVDLDNDGDEDTFYISFTGLNEGTGRNEISSGSMTFSGSTGTISGQNGNDDNEVAFVDWNDDDKLDPLVASLAFTREKLYQNAGTFAAGSFVYQATAFPSGTDSTLDLCLGDFDDDGDIDVFTAQGESGSFLNKLYLNVGAGDTKAPRILRTTQLNVTTPASAVAGGIEFRARIQDASSDNGRNFADAQLTLVATKGPFSQTITVPMQKIGGNTYRALVTVPIGPDGLVGTDLSFTVDAVDGAGNVSTSTPQVTRLCGIEAYGTPSTVNHLTLTGGPAPVVGTNVTYVVSGAPPFQNGALIAGGFRTQIPALGGTLLVNIVPAPFVFPIATDALGQAMTTVQVPPLAFIVGLTATVQAIVFEPALPQQYAFSNGLEVVICDFLGPAPTITNTSPNAAAAGATVTINGADFVSGATVAVAGAPVTVLSTTASTITFVAPVTAGCNVPLVVTNPDGQSAQTTWALAPIVTNAVFASGSAAGGATFLVVGQNFVAGSSVTIGGAAATVNSVSSTLLNLTTPPGTVGAAAVVITTPAGCQAMTTYTYL